MKILPILLSILPILFITGCASTCMEYRSATTAARSEKNLIRAEEWGLKALESSECSPNTDALAPYFLATEVYLTQKKYRKMAEMFTIAEQRNPDQPLEMGVRAFRLVINLDFLSVLPRASRAHSRSHPVPTAS